MIYFMARSNFVPYALYGKKVKQWIFSETIAVFDIKDGGYSQLSENMNLRVPKAKVIH